MSSVTDSGPSVQQYLANSGIRPSLHGGIARYIESGVMPGSFLTAVISNDLIGAICRADDDMTIEELRALRLWFYNDAPSQCHGSPQKMAAWSAAKQKEGKS